MGTVISNLKARFGVDTTDFKKGLKDGDKALDDFKGAAGSKLDEFASMFGVNMGAVNESIGTAFKGLNFLGKSLVAVGDGASKSAVGWKILKTVMISTGIGAIIVALGSIIAYFQKTGEGADKFAKILMQVKSVINNTIERLAVFGKGLWQILTGKFKEGWETMTSAFKGMGEEMREDWKAAGALADRMDALEDREIALITSLSERRTKAAELREVAKNELDDQKKKLDLIRQAETLIKSAYSDEIGLEQERLAIMKEKLALQTKDPTDEQRKEIALQEEKINDLLRNQADQLRGIAREKNTVLKLVNEELALEKMKAEQIAITNVATSNLKFPDFSQAINNVLAPMPVFQQQVKETMVNVSNAINGAFESMAVGFGEFLGALSIGDAGLQDFGNMIIGVFADLAIQVGKIAIGAGLAVLGIKEALMTLNPFVAIAAGVALVALGSAIKGALSNAASGSSATTSLATQSGTYTYDTRTTASQSFKISGQVELVARGSDLVGVIDLENLRKDIST